MSTPTTPDRDHPGPPTTPPNTPDPAGSSGGPEFARADAVAGLAREVDALRRAVAQLDPVPARVDELARLVSQLADTLAAVSTRRASVAAPSWLMLPADPAVVEQVLGELCAWLHAIFLRYPDGATAFPECWMCHPEVVEELLWLMHAWCGAYQDTTASVAWAADWHDRHRPGVVRRIRAGAGSCSTEKHQTRPEWDQHPTGALPVPGLDAADTVTGWWAGRRDDPAPEPARRDQHGASRFGTNRRAR